MSLPVPIAVTLLSTGIALLLAASLAKEGREFFGLKLGNLRPLERGLLGTTGLIILLVAGVGLVLGSSKDQSDGRDGASGNTSVLNPADAASRRDPPTPADPSIPEDQEAVAGWYGFIDPSTPANEEANLQLRTGGFQRVRVPKPYGATPFVQLCESVGLRCELVRDWEGTDTSCPSINIADGTRLGLCQ